MHRLIVLITLWSIFILPSSGKQNLVDTNEIFDNNYWTQKEQYVRESLKMDSLTNVFYNKSNNTTDRLESLKWLAYYITYKRPDAATPFIEEYIFIAKQLSKTYHQAFGLHLLGGIFIKKAEYQKSIVLFHEELKISQKGNHTEYVGHSYLDLGNAYEEVSDLEQASYYYQKGYEHGGEHNLSVIKARGAINLGNVLLIKGDLSNALTYLLSAYQTSKQYGYTGYFASINAHIGEIYQLISNYSEAEQYYTESLLFARKYKNSTREFNALTKLTEIKLSQLKEKEAFNYLTQAKELTESYTLAKGNLLVLEAKIFNIQNNSEKAIQLANQAINTFLKNNDTIKLSLVYPVLAESYLQQRKFKQAIKYAEKALEKAIEEDNFNARIDSELLLYEIYNAKKESRKALNYLITYKTLNDSIRRQQKIYELLLQETQFKAKNQRVLDSLENARTIEQQELVFQQSINQKQKELVVTIFATTLFFFLSIVAGVAWYINRQKRISLANNNRIITNSLYEREILMKELHHRVKNNLQFVTSLLELEKEKTDSESNKKIIEESQSRIHSIALIHEKIYRYESVQDIDFQSYATSLLHDISRLSNTDKKVNIIINGNDLKFDIDTMVPLGIILHELAINALKHAFIHNESPLLKAEVTKDEPSASYLLIVEDNGVGIDEKKTFNNEHQIGLQLVNRLSKQLRGSFEMNKSNGSIFKVRFKDTAQRKNLI